MLPDFGTGDQEDGENKEGLCLDGEEDLANKFKDKRKRQKIKTSFIIIFFELLQGLSFHKS